MQKVEWSRDMALGIPSVDESHKELLQRLNELLAAPDESFGPGFLSMVAEFEADFQEEEKLMEDIDYPGICGHREQHARLLGALHHIASHVMSGDVALGREAAELLPQWFQFHMSTMDTALAFALDLDAREHGQSTSEGDQQHIGLEASTTPR